MHAGGGEANLKSQYTPQFRVGPLTSSPFPTLSLIADPLGLLLLRYDWPQGISVLLSKSGEPPGSSQKARERPKCIFPFSNTIAFSLYSAGGHVGFLLYKRDS